MPRNGRKSHVFASKSKSKPKHSKTPKQEKFIMHSAPLLDTNIGLVERTTVAEISVSQTDGFPRQEEVTQGTQVVDNESTSLIAPIIVTIPQLASTSSLTPRHSDKHITEYDFVSASNSIKQSEYANSSVFEKFNGGDIHVVEEETTGMEGLSTAQGQITDPQASFGTKNTINFESNYPSSLVPSIGVGNNDCGTPDHVQKLVDTTDSLCTKKTPEPECRTKFHSPKKSSRSPVMRSYRSLGPSIMFASLFGTEPLSAYHTVPNCSSAHELSESSQLIQPEPLVNQATGNALDTADVTADAESEPVGGGKSKPIECRSPDRSSDNVSVPFAGKMAFSQDLITDPLLEGVTFCKDVNNPVLYEREPIPEVDSDFSDDEEEYIRTYNALVSVSPPTSPPGKGIGGRNVDIATVFEETSNSDIESSEPEALDPSAFITCRNSSGSSRVSSSSTDFHMENTFLGSTSARDLLDRATLGFNGIISRKALAAAFIRCVADEQADRRSVSPGIDAPGVTFMTEKDVDECMSFETQRRAKLGYVSLFKFLKMIEFDDAAMATEADVLDAWRKAALESRELTKLAKDSPAWRAARRISRSRSGSEQSRGRPRVRPAT